MHVKCKFVPNKISMFGTKIVPNMLILFGTMVL